MESENKKIYKEITEEDLKNDIDVWDVAEPLFWIKDSSENYEDYIDLIDGFTLEQRYLCAVLVYLLEAREDGNFSFFANSSGMLWEDAVNGFKLFKMGAYADNLQKLIDYLGGSLPFDEEERFAFVSRFLTDKGFKALLTEADSFVSKKKGEDEIAEYIRANPDKFVFEWYYYEDEE